MQKHISRREMTRRMEQGRLAMRVLAAATVFAGGTMRIPRDVYESIPLGHKLSCDRDDATGDILLTTIMPATEAPVVEPTFAELREKYGRVHGPRDDEGE